MRIGERLGLAHLAYRRAILRARAEPTPASWRQLVTAGRNLRGAKRDQQRLGRTAAPEPGHPQPGVLLRLLLPVPPASAARSPDLAKECERSHALVRQAQKLVLQSRSLQAELAELRRRWQRTLESRATAAPRPGSSGASKPDRDRTSGARSVEVNE